MRTGVVVNTQFEALHRWENCPHEDVLFLRYPHRHIFYVTFKADVTHPDREIEFVRLKRVLNVFIQENYAGQNLGNKSCEMMCSEIREFMYSKGVYSYYVSVFEDNENGAELFE
jgi:hypothetical protein